MKRILGGVSGVLLVIVAVVMFRATYRTKAFYDDMNSGRSFLERQAVEDHDYSKAEYYRNKQGLPWFELATGCLAGFAALSGAVSLLKYSMRRTGTS